MEEGLDRALLKAYGTQIEKDLEIVKQKIACVIAAHCYYGKQGDSSFATLNRTFEDIFKVYEK